MPNDLVDHYTVGLTHSVKKGMKLNERAEGDTLENLEILN